MTTRSRSIWTLLVCLVPLVLWFGYFNVMYGAQTLACLLPEPPYRAYVTASAALAALLLAGLAAVLIRWRANAGDSLPIGIFDLTLLATIGVAMVVAAALSLPLC
jgi:hypothetical protein